jgi:hypothetical protein
MRFLFRMAFWFSLVLLVIPLGGRGTDDKAGNVAQPQAEPAGAIETFLAVRGAITDLSGICERKPEVCEVGKSAVDTVGVRAREAARIAFALLHDQLGESDDTVVTGSVPPKSEGSDASNIDEKVPSLPVTALAPKSAPKQ